MVNEVRYTSVKRVLEDLLEHPMLSDLTLEQVVRHAMRFIALHGYQKLYQDKIEDVEIHEFRGLLPCDLVRINQVKEVRSGICLRAMTDNFTPGMQDKPMQHPDHSINNPPHPYPYSELAFKTQGRVIFTSFPEGVVTVAYKAIPVDEDGFPMVLDNEVYLGALEAYIKKQVFTVKFDTGKIAASILQNAQTDYALLSHELRLEFTTPSVSEAEALSRFATSLIPRVREFDRGFEFMGNRQWIRRH